jgi:AraC family transcriptional regulator
MATVEQTGALVRALPEELVRTLVSTLPYRSSCRLNWPGVEVHRYRMAKTEVAEHSMPHLCIYLPHVEEPFNAELTVGGRTLTARFNNQCVSIMPAGIPRAFRRESTTPYELTLIVLDHLTLTGIARAQTGLDFPEIVPQFGIVDPLVRSIGMMLDAELAAERPSPRVYAESLAMALAAQVFAKYAKPLVDDMRSLGSSRSQIRRSIEYINDNLASDLPLDDIAKAANMSKYHFAKSFRHVVGMPPHQYVVRMRVEKARKLLTAGPASLEEVAHQVGYTDVGQFSEQFLKIVGTTPGRYRMNS